jgi:tetratricopeptide (TPR) repeat protein
MKYNEETDPLKREAWVDTLMMIYDDRIKYWGHSPSSREGLVLGRKAVDLFTYRPNNVMEVYEISKRSIEIEGNRSQADVLLVNMQMLIRLVEAGLEPVSKILETYDILMNIVDFNLENNPADERFFAPAKGQIDAMFEPYATCENIITLFQPRFDREPENIELLEKVTSMLSNSGCTEEKLFFDATRNLHRLQPNANSAFLMGRLENNRQNYRDAIKYFEEAVSLYENESDKFTALMLLADITYRNLRQFSQARSYALQASAIDPENGRPYILIGEMYAASASACGDNDLTKTVAYWAAVDKFVQARNIDNETIVQERATQLINSYSQYFPSIEIIFFYGLSEGDSYRVECWINETTRVRARR